MFKTVSIKRKMQHKPTKIGDAKNVEHLLKKSIESKQSRVSPRTAPRTKWVGLLESLEFLLHHDFPWLLGFLWCNPFLFTSSSLEVECITCVLPCWKHLHLFLSFKETKREAFALNLRVDFGFGVLSNSATVKTLVTGTCTKHLLYKEVGMIWGCKWNVIA